ncbi:MAG: L-2-amino-thiazoline-4-carboxylic acid hydrolase [Desulfobacter sp.]|nr:MAG: L-2-amino-thiazoline-4-carboxylic acid hydrolase [Desulfobacter sp.]
MMTPEHHAMLLGFFIEEILNHLGETGESVVAKAVCRYGEGRGRRMAQAAAKDCRKNDALGFLLYGEINWDDTGNRFKVVRGTPFFCLRAEKCFWHGIWQKNHMQAAGRHYCRYIDPAILKGFNPSLEFEVAQRMGEGADCCIFNYGDWQLGVMDKVKYLLLRSATQKNALKSWAFHCADVYRTFSCVLERETKDGDAVMEVVRRRFEKQFGKQAAGELSAHLASGRR